MERKFLSYTIEIKLLELGTLPTLTGPQGDQVAFSFQILDNIGQQVITRTTPHFTYSEETVADYFAELLALLGKNIVKHEKSK